MASMKDIRQRMANVQTTKQVINAMDMVAVTRLHKARARLAGIRPLQKNLRKVVGDLLTFDEVLQHPLAEHRPVKNTAYVIITSDKGLCGSYNVNVCQAALAHMNQGRSERIFAVGNKGLQYFRRRHKKITRRITNASEVQVYQGSERLAQTALALYESGEVDEVYIAYTRFDTTLNYTPVVEKLLPLGIELTGAEESLRQYEPDVSTYLEHMLPLYLHMRFFAALSESLTCEHAARMVNMESAGKNADEIIDDLKQMYNRKRQTAITQELNEIVGSANILQ